jgi:hypothetical protein
MNFSAMTIEVNLLFTITDSEAGLRPKDLARDVRLLGNHQTAEKILFLT